MFILITSKFHNYSATFTVKVKSEWGKTGKTRTRDRLWSLFLCVITDWLLFLLLLLYIHSISRLTTTIATTTTTIITLFLIDCVCGSLKDYYDLLALFVRANKFESENACVRVCVCVCARGTRLPYIFLTTSTSHFFYSLLTVTEKGVFWLVRENPASLLYFSFLFAKWLPFFTLCSLTAVFFDPLFLFFVVVFLGVEPPSTTCLTVGFVFFFLSILRVSSSWLINQMRTNTHTEVNCHVRGKSRVLCR